MQYMYCFTAVVYPQAKLLDNRQSTEMVSVQSNTYCNFGMFSTLQVGNCSNYSYWTGKHAVLAQYKIWSGLCCMLCYVLINIMKHWYLLDK